MATVTPTPAMLDDLMRTEGKAELIGGRVVRFMATGMRPAEVAANVADSLRAHVRATGRGRAWPDGVGFTVPTLPSGRQSFQPDASYYEGPLPSNPMRFVPGPPTFAVEVRSEHDPGPAADAEYAAKRADYFAAGTLAVWDVDPVHETVALYLPGGGPPAVFVRGQVAHAGPAVPGWTVLVDDVFA
jgi:Uma2 family endonuclease